MRVKLFGFRLDIKGGGWLGGPAHVVNAEQVEASINAWLASCRDVRVMHIQQTTTGVSGIGGQYLFVTVWYEDGDAPNVIPQA